jgi:hypothetical protein
LIANPLTKLTPAAFTLLWGGVVWGPAW